MLTALAPELNPNDQIQFAAFHRVEMPPGDYTLDAAQDVTIDGVRHWFPMETRVLSVLGERFQISPDQIHAVFPPAGSRGDFWRDLPHTILERSTLPWERTAFQGVGGSPETDPPWLALLVFHGDESPAPRAEGGRKLGRAAVELGSLINPVHGPDFRWPGISKREFGQHDSDLVTVIDVPWRLLSEQLPAFEYQNHCRRRLAFLGEASSAPDQILAALGEVLKGQSADPLSPDPRMEKMADAPKWHVRDLATHREFEIWQGDDKKFTFYRVASEKALIMGRRLPMPGVRNSIHLVSLEGRYQRTPAGLDAQGATDADAIRLVSLFEWEFFCEEPTMDFKGLIEHLNSDGRAAAFQLPIPDAAKGQDSEQFLNAGFVPLVHKFRQGSRSVSWYHGPLVPSEPQIAKLEPHPYAADELLILDSGRGMFDVSYAAAWELGRMLTLRNTRVATRLYHWKRDHVRWLNSTRHLAEYAFELPVHSRGLDDSPDTGLPHEVSQWLNELTLLCHVPFPYLVPDPRLLPLESLRFFTLDRLWLECLRDGAYSIGRVQSGDAQIDAHAKALAQPKEQTIPVISGFLLRSEAVSGFWESLRVRAYSTVAADTDATSSELNPKAHPAMTLLRMERLSPNVMICLFVDKKADQSYGDGAVKMVDFHLKPEMLHFGFDESDGVPAKLPAGPEALQYLTKPLRDAKGAETNELRTPWTPEAAAKNLSRIVDLAELAKTLGESGDAARFALTMTAGTELVRVILGNHAPEING